MGGVEDNVFLASALHRDEYFTLRLLYPREMRGGVGPTAV
jgi:hypothetical protein